MSFLLWDQVTVIPEQEVLGYLRLTVRCSANTFIYGKETLKTTIGITCEQWD